MQHCVEVSLYRFWWLSVTTSPPRLDSPSHCSPVLFLRFGCPTRFCSQECCWFHDVPGGSSSSPPSLLTSPLRSRAVFRQRWSCRGSLATLSRHCSVRSLFVD